MLFALFYTHTYKMSGSGAAVLAFFSPKLGDMGAELRGKQTLKLLRQNPHLMC